MRHNSMIKVVVYIWLQIAEQFHMFQRWEPDLIFQKLMTFFKKYIFKYLSKLRMADCGIRNINSVALGRY